MRYRRSTPDARKRLRSPTASPATSPAQVPAGAANANLDIEAFRACKGSHIASHLLQVAAVAQGSIRIDWYMGGPARRRRFRVRERNRGTTLLDVRRYAAEFESVSSEEPPRSDYQRYDGQRTDEDGGTSDRG